MFLAQSSCCGAWFWLHLTSCQKLSLLCTGCIVVIMLGACCLQTVLGMVHIRGVLHSGGRLHAGGWAERGFSSGCAVCCHEPCVHCTVGSCVVCMLLFMLLHSASAALHCSIVMQLAPCCGPSMLWPAACCDFVHTRRISPAGQCADAVELDLRAAITVFQCGLTC
jgi:hypothetical protein